MDGSQQTASFTINSKTAEFVLDIQNSNLKWTVENKKKPCAVCIPVCDVLWTSVSGASWSFDYVKRGLNKWTRCTVAPSGEESVCQQWAEDVRAAANAAQERPKNLLVFINPDGGKKTGVKDYRNIAAPLFEKAGIKTDVIVTEDGDHASKVIATYDISTLDGLVSVGGDGTLMRVINGLLQRQMKDTGRNPDDPDEQIPVTQLPIGIVPSGTGQGMVRIATGVMDADIPSACYNIILGASVTGSLLSTFCDRRLVYYGVMQSLYGVFGDLMKVSEDRRNLGRFRYVYALTKSLFNIRTFDATVNCLLDNPQDETPEWVTSSGHYMAINTSLWRIPDPEVVVHHNNWVDGGAVTYTIDASAGKKGHAKHMFAMIRQKPNAYDMPEINLNDVKAVKYELPPPPSGDSSFQHVINIDGDVFVVPQGQIEIRLHKKRVRIFGSGVDTSELEAKLAAKTAANTGLSVD